MQINRFIAIVSALSLSIALSASEKKTAKPDAEAKQRAAEAAEEETLNPESALRAPILRGNFSFSEDPKNPKLVGSFTVNGRELRVEIEREALRVELAPCDGKVISLSGKIRDGGKTLIVQTIERGGPPPAAMSNPRGL